MDFFSHRYDFGLTDLWIKRFLHLFLKSVLPLPQQDLSFRLHNLVQNLCLLLFLLRDLVFKFDRLVLKLFQLLLEFVLDVLVLTTEFLLLRVVLVVHVVKFVHVEF